MDATKKPTHLLAQQKTDLQREIALNSRIECVRDKFEGKANEENACAMNSSNRIPEQPVRSLDEPSGQSARGIEAGRIERHPQDRQLAPDWLLEVGRRSENEQVHSMCSPFVQDRRKERKGQARCSPHRQLCARGHPRLAGRLPFLAANKPRDAKSGINNPAIVPQNHPAPRSFAAC